jgi:uncharacterized membrane protein
MRHAHVTDDHAGPNLGDESISRPGRRRARIAGRADTVRSKERGDVTPTTDEWGALAGRPAIDRVGVAFAAGLLAGIVVSFWSPWELTLLVGWDVAAAVFLAWVWLTVWGMDAGVTHRYASREDSSRVLADSAVVTASVACLGAVAFILVKAGAASGATKALFMVVGVMSVVLAWAVVHSVFALRYAANFYADPVGGVDFKQRELPRFSDFAYLAATLGMTFQVSDTDLTTESIRRLALRHALLSYLFGAVILGLVINVVASLLHG